MISLGDANNSGRRRGEVPIVSGAGLQLDEVIAAEQDFVDGPGEVDTGLEDGLIAIGSIIADEFAAGNRNDVVAMEGGAARVEVIGDLAAGSEGILGEVDELDVAGLAVLGVALVRDEN